MRRVFASLLFLVHLSAMPSAAATFCLKGLGHSKDLSSNDVKGLPLALQFWASWCASCSGVSVELAALLKQHPTILYVPISLDETAEAAALGAEKLRRTFAVNQDFYFDQDRRLADQFGEIAVPTLVILDHQGKIRGQITGHWGTAQRKELASLLSSMTRVEQGGK